MSQPPLQPRKAINQAYLKVKVSRAHIETFKSNLLILLDHINLHESEEFHKNLVADFLKNTYYGPKHFINTKGRNDLVIHNGTTANSTVGVIIEAKSPMNKGEMVRTEQLNAKAMHELVLYYLRERITLKNLEIKHLIATNIYEWFVFDAALFEKEFAQNKSLVKQFSDFEEGRLAGKNTDFFYANIAKVAIDNINHEVVFTHFDLRTYEKTVRNTNKTDDTKLIALYKLLSPEHLLKLPYANDSNSLDKTFYAELLHIIGLTEVKEGGKKLIQRKSEGQRNSASLIESTIFQLDQLDKLRQLKNPAQYGTDRQERLFNVALELVITWINRVLFLKLLEAQLLKYQKGNMQYAFLSIDRVKDFDALNKLFFSVLAVKPELRNERVKLPYAHVPYLNSSLFEPTELEQTCLFISQLEAETLSLWPSTVIKNHAGKRRSGHADTLEYLFEFLNAYDFSSDGGEEIQEDNKSLINASVLGLIFEKINGYRDGSFFTPGFVTMYMCRETILRAVIQKFNETKGWNCQSLHQLYDKIDDRAEANAIVNSLKICDPAVGSGHFLVSALNEIIAIKSELRILSDRRGQRLKEYQFTVVNDELMVTDEDGQFVNYNPHNAESQRIQEALFHEKQTIIENCLFGVDINPNSVKICRLRLWIELLKNAYYKSSYSPPSQGGVPEGSGGLNTTHSSGFNHEPPRPAATPPYKGGELEKAASAKHNLPYLKTFRKELRSQLTPAEATLWTMLKGKNLEGRKFRRQHSVANYILDFYCPEERLAVELDGQGHFEATQAEYDSERDLFLLHVGIKVLRFENRIVWENPEGLLQAICNQFGWFNTLNSPPSQGGVPEGGGGFFPNPLPAGFGGLNSNPLPEGLGGLNTNPLPAGSTGLNTTHLPDGSSGFNYEPPRPAATPPYKGGEQLETLPNIDINIKCGNSLIARYPLDANIKAALKRSKWTIDGYRLAVMSYRNAQSKDEKRKLEELIESIKSDFETEVAANDKRFTDLNKAKGTLLSLTMQTSMFERTKAEKAKWDKEVKSATETIAKLETQLAEIRHNRIYENAFEWRFEFPEVLNNDGDFVGFDVVIGNPPYIRQEEFTNIKGYLQANYQTYAGTADLYVYFVERGLQLAKQNGQFIYILPNKWMRAGYGSALRKWVEQYDLQFIHDFGDLPVFDEATTYPCLWSIAKRTPQVRKFMASNINTLDFPHGLNNHINNIAFAVNQELLSPAGWTLVDNKVQHLLEKIKSKGTPLGEYVNGKVYYGIKTGFNDAFVIDAETKMRLIAEDPKSAQIIKPFLAGRDIKRYQQPKSDKFLILFKSGDTQKLFGKIDESLAWEKLQSLYPAVTNHLLQFRAECIKRYDKGQYWWELRACDYYNEFEKEKIIIPAITNKANYGFDNQCFYSNDKTSIITDVQKYILALLNSYLLDFFLKKIASTKQNGFFEFKPVYVAQLPIVNMDSDIKGK